MFRGVARFLFGDLDFILPRWYYQGYENVPVKAIFDILVCASKFRDRLPEGALSPKQLKDFPVVAYFKGMPSRTILDQYLEENGVQLTLAHEFSHASSVIRQAQEPFSLAFLLEYSVQLELDPPPPCRYYYLIKPMGRQTNLSRKLIEFISEERQALL